MPKNKINYENTIIYKIVCNDLNINDIYIGHTTDFYKRKSLHKSACNNEKSIKYNYKIYQTIRDNGGWSNWSMIQIEIYSCKNNREAESRERYWIEKLNSKLNIYIPTRTKKEYYENNKEEILQYCKEYYENNKDEILQNNKKYYENNKDEILENKKQYYENNKDEILEYRKQYYENNKDEILENRKQYYENNKKEISQYYKKYYENNKEKINKMQKELLPCLFCGCTYSKSNKSQHEKSIKHKNNSNSNSSSDSN